MSEKLSVDEVVKEIISGKHQWGFGEERKIRLAEAGYDYQEVQSRVNDFFRENVLKDI